MVSEPELRDLLMISYRVASARTSSASIGPALPGGGYVFNGPA